MPPKPHRKGIQIPLVTGIQLYHVWTWLIVIDETFKSHHKTMKAMCLFTHPMPIIELFVHYFLLSILHLLLHWWSSTSNTGEGGVLSGYFLTLSVILWSSIISLTPHYPSVLKLKTSLSFSNWEDVPNPWSHCLPFSAPHHAKESPFFYLVLRLPFSAKMEQ